MATSRPGKPCSQAPINNVAQRQNALIDGLTAHATTPFTQAPNAFIVAPMASMAAPFKSTPLYARTHAFLI